MISILLPTKNQTTLFPASYGSLIFQLQDTTELCEIIVVNDNKPGENPQMTECLTNLSVDFCLGPSAGSIAAFEYAVSLAKGDKLLFVNDDMAFYQPFITPMLEAFSKGYSIVGAKLLYENLTVQHAGMEFLPQHEWTSNHRYRFHPHDDPLVNSFEEVPAVTFSLTLVDTKMFHELGGFGTEYAENYADTTFCLRALEAGYKICYEPKASAIHYESATRGHNEKVNEECFNTFKATWVRTGRLKKLLGEKGFLDEHGATV